MEQNNDSRQKIFNSLLESHHGKYNEYVPQVLEGTQGDPEFISKLMVWNLAKGEIKDSKIAFPIISLRKFNRDDRDLAENAVSCLLALDPRSIVKAYKFNKELSGRGVTIPGGNRRILEVGIKLYLKDKENDMKQWDRIVLQHRHSMKHLYAISHLNVSQRVRDILFDNNPPKNSVFAKLKQLKDMSPEEAAGTILNHKIPFLIAMGALGRKKEDYIKFPELPLAIMSIMSGQQLIANTNMLKGFGVFSSPILQSEYNKALERAKKDKRVSTLKAQKAIQIIEDIEPEKAIADKIIKKLSDVQEEKIQQKTIEGDWVVLGDCSGSMQNAIAMAIEIASYIAKSVAGKVHLIFFNTAPRYMDVTGKTLEQIRNDCKRIYATGGTACGCGLQYLADRNISVDGIAIVSDGGDNTRPLFTEGYRRFEEVCQKSPPVYFYRLRGESDKMTAYCQREGIDLETNDMEKTDYYSLPNLVGMMKTVKYSLIDEVMNTDLLTFKDVFTTI